MEITLKQAYDIFIADRETSCADETISASGHTVDLLKFLLLSVRKMNIAGIFRKGLSCLKTIPGRSFLYMNQK